MKNYRIPRIRKKFLLEKFKEFSFVVGGNGDDLPADKEAFESIDDPAEIHFIVENYNWDDGPSVLNWIVNSPLCTKASALIIFWSSAPDYYMEFEKGSVLKQFDDKVDEYNTEVFRLLENVVERVEKDNFHELDIYFDSKLWVCKLLVDNPKWFINEELFNKTGSIRIV